MLRKDLPIRTNLTDSVGGSSGSITVYANPIVSKVRTNLLSDSGGITIPEPLPDLPWNPSYTNAILWLDSSESDSVILDGSGNVSQWLDLSGNGHHSTQVSTTKRPAYTASKIVFDGVNDFLDIGASSIFNTDKICLVMTLKFASISGTQIPIRSAYTSGASTTSNILWGCFSETSSFSFHARSSGGTLVRSISTIDTSTFLFSGVWGSDDAVTQWKNGSVLTAGTGATATPTGHQLTRIGCNSASEGFFFGGEISNIIILPEEERIKAEGYLAHKESLTSLLPSGHPYKTNPPTIYG